MNDLIPSASVEGKVNVSRRRISTATESTRSRCGARIGMVFQKPNPFPKSIYDNIALGRASSVFKEDMDEIVERCPHVSAALWDEVKDKLKESALGAVRRSAAAVVHRAGAGDRSRT